MINHVKSVLNTFKYATVKYSNMADKSYEKFLKNVVFVIKWQNSNKNNYDNNNIFLKGAVDKDIYPGIGFKCNKNK